MKGPVKMAAGYKSSPEGAVSLFSLSLEGEPERVLPPHLMRRVFKTGSVPVCADWSGISGRPAERSAAAGNGIRKKAGKIILRIIFFIDINNILAIMKVSRWKGGA